MLVVCVHCINSFIITTSGCIHKVILHIFRTYFDIYFTATMATCTEIVTYHAWLTELVPTHGNATYLYHVSFTDTISICCVQYDPEYKYKCSHILRSRVRK